MGGRAVVETLYFHSICYESKTLLKKLSVHVCLMSDTVKVYQIKPGASVLLTFDCYAADNSSRPFSTNSKKPT